MITKAEHDKSMCRQLMMQGYGDCFWCEMEEKSAAGLDDLFVAAPEHLDANFETEMRRNDDR
jgi:hypothetical protein